MDLAHERYEELERAILAAHPNADVASIRAAFEYANELSTPSPWRRSSMSWTWTGIP